MDPMTAQAAAAAGQAAVGLLARLIGEALAAGDYERARQLREQAVADYGDEILPVLERIEADTIGQTAYSDVKADPRLSAAQMTALDRLSAFTEPGMSPEDEAEQRAAMEAAGGVAARQAASAGQLAARRGLLRSGLGQALGQDAAETGAQTAADAAARLAAQRRQQRLAALSSFGNMAGGIREQDVGEQQTRAGAVDSLNRFNANMTHDARKARNAAAQAQFDAQMRLRDARNSARGNLANTYEGRGRRTSEVAKDIGAGASQGVGAAGDYASKFKKGPNGEWIPKG